MVDDDTLDDAAREVAADLGERPERVVPAPAQGQVNRTVFVGDDLVVRLPRTDKAAEQLAKEAKIIPVVRDAGVPTAGLIRYDPTGRVTRLPYMVQERMRGHTMAARTPDPTVHRRTLDSLAEVLTALHQLRRDDVDPIPEVPAPYSFSVTELLDDLLHAGEIGAAQRDDLLGSFRLLQPMGPSVDSPVLVHRDVIPSNILVDADGTVSALLDWGCAEWGNPARDVVGLPIEDLPALAAAYRSALGRSSRTSGPPTLERDALWYHRYLALARLLKRPSTSADRNWAAPRSASLLDLLAFTSTERTEPWSVLLRHETTR